MGSSLDLGVFLEDEDFLLGERSLTSPPSSTMFTFSTNFSKSSIFASGVLSETPTLKMAFLSSTFSIYSIAEKSASSLSIASIGRLSSIIGDNSTFYTRATMSSIYGEFYSEITFFSLLSGEPGINFSTITPLVSATTVTGAVGYSGFAESASVPSDG